MSSVSDPKENAHQTGPCNFCESGLFSVKSLTLLHLKPEPGSGSYLLWVTHQLQGHRTLYAACKDLQTVFLKPPFSRFHVKGKLSLCASMKTQSILTTIFFKKLFNFQQPGFSYFDLSMKVLCGF